MAAFLLITVLPAAPAAADPYDDIAAELCRAAARHAKARVAVLPFQSVGKRNGQAGEIVSEKLTAAVVARGQVEVVERTLLAAVMREQRLMRSGAVDLPTIKELGRILGVDALAAGTLTELRDGRFEVNGRLIDAQSARILAAVSARVRPDWAQSLFDDMSWPAPGWGAFELAPAAAAEPGAPDCGRAGEEIDELDRAVLDVKARYWAGRLRDRDIERGSLKRNPGSEIRNLETRREFYRILRAHFDDGALRRVGASEFARLRGAQAEIDRLAEACGLDGA
ncbi:MAG: FlgO family outer membrane protein [Elusimicrobia bacterium]|nr:FlgO family outer membrane protein [Elusimicrobiota bacterium]